MIRGHMATFPLRRDVVERAVQSLLPQIDRLFVVLNEYETPPAWADHPKIEAVIPDRDLKDAGKFYFTAAPDDVVFLVDDDIAYPPDYVASTLAPSSPPLDQYCVGYFGNALTPKPQGGIRWKTYQLGDSLEGIQGASVLGTGTTCCVGANMPKLNEIERYMGMCDLGFAEFQLVHDRLLWALPRPADWLRSILPEELVSTSLYETVHKARSRRQMVTLRRLARGWPHAGAPYSEFIETAVKVKTG